MNTIEYQHLLENKVHTEDAFPYNTYLCSIPQDFSCVPIHWHDEIELIIIQKGEGYVSVDLIEYSVCAGDIIFVLPGKLHSIYEKKGCRMEYENIIFRKELLLSLKDDLCSSTFLEPLFSGNIMTDWYIHSSVSYYSQIHTIIRSIDDVCSRMPNGYQLAIKGYLYQFFFVIVSNHKQEASQTTDQKKLEKIKSVVKYVEQHYSDPITLSDMAALCCYSESHFMKFFKQQMKESFVSYLNHYRLTIATSLLVNSPATILEIANSVGFDNLSYFNRLFKKQYGITPKQMR